jgi:hypothetical protein
VKKLKINEDGVIRQPRGEGFAIGNYELSCEEVRRILNECSCCGGSALPRLEIKEELGLNPAVDQFSEDLWSLISAGDEGK